ncbi:MAG: phage tail tube protein [Elusimicrobiota bacterium]|jgi:hypothetical protein
MSDPAIGNNSVVVVDFEQSWGVAKAVPKGRKISVVKCGILPTQALIANPSLRASFNPAKPFLAQPKSQGPITLIPNVQVLPFIQKLVTGTLVKTGTVDPFTGTSKLGTTMPLSAIVEGSFDIGGTLKYGVASGVRINGWTIPISFEGPLQLSLDAMAKNVVFGDVAYDATPDDWTIDDPVDQMHLISGFVKLGGSTVGYIKGGQLQGAANLQDDFRAGLLGRGSLVPKTHGLTGSLQLALESVAVLTLVTGGAPTDIEFKWLVAAGRSWTVKYHVLMEKTGPAVEDGLVEVPVNFQGFEDTAVSTSVTFATELGVDPDTEYV